MTTESGRAPSGQALAVPATPANAVDGPSGFDPSRMSAQTTRDLIRGVAERFRRQHERDLDSAAYWDRDVGGRTKRKIYEGLLALDVETCGVSDVVAAGLHASWVTEDCDFCGKTQELWFRLGDEPDYEARWLDLCAKCIAEASAFAIATEARRAETENTGSVHEGAGPQDIAQGPSQ